MPGAVASWPLTGQGTDAGGLQGVDRRLGQAVVGGEHGVDAVAGVDEDLLHDRLGLVVVPAGHVLVGDERPVAGVDPGLDRLGVAVAEQEGVVVLLAAVEHHDPRAVERRARRWSGSSTSAMVAPTWTLSKLT